MNKTSKRDVWKIDVSEKVEVEAIHTTLTGVCNRMMQKNDLEGTDAVIDRIDIKKDKTTVFLSGKKRAVDVFSKALKVSYPKAKIMTSGLKTSDIKKFQESL